MWLVRCFIVVEFSAWISEKPGRKGLGPGQMFYTALAANFKMAAMTQLLKLFSRKRKAAEEGLHYLLTMNNEMSKRHFTEELSFETEVAQAAALSTILILLFSRSFSSLNSSDKSNLSKSFEISSKTWLFEDFFKASVSSRTAYCFFLLC